MTTLDDYARITLQRELIDTLWKAQAEKMGMSTDAPRWLIRAAVAIHEITPAFVDVASHVADALLGFGQSLMSGFAGGLRKKPALPLNHGQRCHTNRTRTR